MNKHCYLLLQIMFLLSCCITELSAQDSSQTAPEFLVGTFVHLSDSNGYTHYNYDSVLALGVNTVFQTAIKNDQYKNLSHLGVFPTVYAANDSGTGTGDTRYDAETENIDWISYFTHAKYRKWEAEGEGGNIFKDTDSVRIKHQGGERYDIPDGTEGWKTNIESDSGDAIIYGPHYWQYPRYTFSNPGWNPAKIDYKAAFRMKIDSIPGIQQEVCHLIVINTDSNNVDSVLTDSLITTSELDTDYVDIILEYDYSNYYDAAKTNYNYLPSPGIFDYEDALGYNQGSKVQFKVVWLGNRELFVDYIEIYDKMIWEEYFELNYGLLINRISTYDQVFATKNPAFYEKLKYYYTQDEPGSIDCYEPLRKVQFILDSLNINADLLTHWYPYWDGHPPRFGGDLSWPIYNQLAQPKKLYFWYSPFTFQDGAPQARDFTLNNFRMNLQWAHIEQPGFYIAAQTFGIKEQNGDWYIYMTPTPAEVGAETMLSLAHGVEGIYYELYYSYCRTCDKYVEGLVNFPDSNYAKRDIWIKVQELASRLRGTLGNYLMKLDYTGDYLMLRQLVRNLGETGNFQGDYLTLNPTSEDSLNFHAGLFIDSTYLDNDYFCFLLTNQMTTGNDEVKVKVTARDTSYENWRFRNIETECNLDTTFTDSLLIDIEFPAGEGYLYHVAPVVKYGGTLIYDEVIYSSTTLYNEMTIENGAELSLSADYTCYANIIVKDGKITRSGTGKLIFDNGFKLIIEGDAEVSGTAQNKLEINFDTPMSLNGILVDSLGSLDIKNCLIKNADLGISVKSYYNH
ncbi:MAG: hypothetical protein DRQ13_01925, partial [Ignavibacteriae bacterium]